MKKTFLLMLLAGSLNAATTGPVPYVATRGGALTNGLLVSPTFSGTPTNAPWLTNNSSGVTLSGDFAGNGASLSNITVDVATYANSAGSTTNATYAIRAGNTDFADDANKAKYLVGWAKRLQALWVDDDGGVSNIIAMPGYRYYGDGSGLTNLQNTQFNPDGNFSGTFRGSGTFSNLLFDNEYFLSWQTESSTIQSNKSTGVKIVQDGDLNTTTINGTNYVQTTNGNVRISGSYFGDGSQLSGIVAGSATNAIANTNGTGYGTRLLGATNDIVSLTNGVRIAAYSRQENEPDTNWIYLVLSGSDEANGAYQWTTDRYVGTNCSIGMVGDIWVLTNFSGSGLSLYQTTNTAVNAWETWFGTNPAPTGTYGTNTVSKQSLQITSQEGPAVFPHGLSSYGGGGSFNFGDNTSLLTGLGMADGFDHNQYPSVIFSSQNCVDYGRFDTILSSVAVTNWGHSIAAIASGEINASAGNMRILIAGSEFCAVTNLDGVSVTLACNNITNNGRTDISAIGLLYSYIDSQSDFSSFPYGSYLFATNVHETFTGGNRVTNSGAIQSLMLANYSKANTLSNSFVIGSGLNVSGKTNHMLLGMNGGTLEFIGSITATGLVTSGTASNVSEPYLFTNGAALISYSTTNAQPLTNWVYLTTAGTPGVNGAYYWSTDHYQGSNVNYGFFLDGDFWTLTNGTEDLVYQSDDSSIANWSVYLTGDEPGPRGKYGTNMVAVASVGISNSTAPFYAPKGIDSGGAGGSLNLGYLTTVLRGTDQTTLGSHEVGPSLVAASSASTDTGFLDTILSSSSITNRGDGVSVLSSSFIDASGQNNAIAIIASQSGVASNANWANAVIASQYFTNHAAQGSAVIASDVSYIDGNSEYISVPYGNNVQATNVKRGIIGGNSVSGTAIERSVLLANYSTAGTSSNVFAIGSGLSVSGKTNHMELGVSGGTVQLVGTVSGNGSGLTNLNASALSSGTVDNARLPANVLTNGQSTPVTFSNAVTVVGGILATGAQYIAVSNGTARVLLTNGNVTASGTLTAVAASISSSIGCANYYNASGIALQTYNGAAVIDAISVGNTGTSTIYSNLVVRGAISATNGFNYLPTNAAPASVTVGTTAPDAWVWFTNAGVVFKMPAWKDH